MYGINRGLVIFGIILLAIGLPASFYRVTRHILIGDHPDGEETIYPLRDVGIVLIVAGIIFIPVGFLYSPRHYHFHELVQPRKKVLNTLLRKDKLGVLR